MPAITHISGPGLPLRGDDIDTDRIMPARFLRAVSFEGLERHIFEEDRAANASHPFNDPRYRGAAVLVVNANFGCGSSREHAPQVLARAGSRAIVGESFSEIFRGNAAMIGIPCVTADRGGIARLQTAIERGPQTAIEVDIASESIAAAGVTLAGSLPPALKDAFVSGQWNPTTMLLANYSEVQAVANGMPYMRGV